MRHYVGTAKMVRHVKTSATPHWSRHSVVTAEQQVPGLKSLTPYCAASGFLNFIVTANVSRPYWTVWKYDLL